MKRRCDKRLRSYIPHLRENYYAKTAFSSATSLLVGFAFLIYNGVLGVMYGAVWNISISIYYLILFAVKLYILLAAGKALKYSEHRTAAYRKKVFRVSFLILALLDFVLIAPIIDMALGHRAYTFGLIPAIAMAAYTTYRVTASIVHYRKSRKADNLFLLEVRTINIIDTLVAVLTLQNALVIAMGGHNGGLRKLTFCTSVGILILIIGITAASYHKGRKLCADHVV